MAFFAPAAFLTCLLGATFFVLAVPAPAPFFAAGSHNSASIVAAMRTWVERAVVGLTLCPFAKAVHVKGQVRYVVSRARTPEALVADLARGLHALAAIDPEEIDNTLVIAPYVLDDFLDFNAFLDVADATVEALGYAGVLQVASFHPRYQFEGTEPDDVSNFSNRAPYPVLHLLREASVDRAVAAYPDADAIPNRNIATLRRLGLAGWAALGVDPPDH